MSHLPPLDSATDRTQTVNWTFGSVPEGREAKAGLDTSQGLINTTLLGKAPYYWDHAPGM